MYISDTIIVTMLNGFWLKEKNPLNSFGVFELSGISGQGYILLFGFQQKKFRLSSYFFGERYPKRLLVLSSSI